MKIFRLILIFIISTTIVLASAGYAGAYMDMAVSVKGLSMGGAGVAIPGHTSPMSNNPAGLPFIKNREANFNYYFLTLDRVMHYGGLSLPVEPTAGLGIAWIHAGVENIQGRSNTGRKTETYETGEDAIIFSFSNAVTEKLSFGISLKYLQYFMHDLSANSVGLDVGFLYKLAEDLQIGAQLRDVNSGYNWDTEDLFGETESSQYKDSFPIMSSLGIAWSYKSFLFSGELNYSSKNRFEHHIGAEYNYNDYSYIRVGLNNSIPTFGVGVEYEVFDGVNTQIGYGMMLSSVGQGTRQLFSWKFEF